MKTTKSIASNILLDLQGGLVFLINISHCQNPLDSPIQSSSALQTFGVPAECQIPRDAHFCSTKQNLYPVNPALSLSLPAGQTMAV